ncbi:GTP cyclohydrolase FolE2 [Desulfoluna spongiiphila]|uniref:GTP cyclohydrolase FolE2 n=1 Tax=Desulfoluna spongiiphila TaxID=419481 RepID=A0A1G5FPS4_9BACT|nr:GTP cyclohydrolase FolE2 [Desulfoluna spongiiphila]SCY41137.1 GTP cyclohydrolase I [Desulfoluna spongiiphila]VVS95481.1 gtp cyclohydrolase fole2 [Desulfoluna spongiiphila]
MIDMQKQPDYRNIPIDQVGIKNLKYPVRVLDRSNGTQHTVASINMYVDLPHHSKGTHMSRFVELLHSFRNDLELSLTTLSHILDEMKKILGAKSSHVDITFPYFIEKKAPESGSPGLVDYSCRFLGTSNEHDEIDLISEVVVPITSLCPCSKEISTHGAHNQRGEVRLATRFRKFNWIEDMIELVEQAASCEIYSVLKRVDEKFVTEQAYNNPKFVEDIVRDIATALNRDDNITWFQLSAENFESIHNHSAYAYIASSKEGIVAGS